MVNSLYRSKPARSLNARPSKQINESRHLKSPKTKLSRDIAAMKKVWRMLREGSARWIGEVGRQY